MADAPERLWLKPNPLYTEGWNFPETASGIEDGDDGSEAGQTEYVRADLYEQVKRDLVEKRRDRIGDSEKAGAYLCRAEAAERLAGAIRELIASYRERFTDEKVDYQRGILDTLDNVEMVLAGTHDDAALAEPKPVGVDDDPPENWFNYRSVRTTEPTGEAEQKPVAWMDSTGGEIHPIIKNYQKEDMIRNGGVQAKRAVHYSIALYTK